MPIETIMEKDNVIADDAQSLADNGFYWKKSGGLKVLKCQALTDAGFQNGFSTRVGGVSPFPENDLNLAGFDEDLAKNIHENRRRFLRTFDGEYQLATVWQVHGDDVKVIKTISEAANSDEKFDAIISQIPGILAGAKTADCVPVLIGDPKTRAFAAVHAGWRGTVNSIAAKALRAMMKEFGTDPADAICAIGPAACGRNYEIGQEVIDEFARSFSNSEKYFSATKPGHALVDLHMSNRDQLAAEGVTGSNIYTAPFCTMERTDLFFSYRKEKFTNGKTGRLLSVIGLK
jgi:YfiH family protein